MDKQTISCRLCQKDTLVEVLDLGMMPASDDFRTYEQLQKEETVLYPLVLCMCSECGLLQLNYIVDKSTLYNENYPYEMSGTEAGKKHYLSFADSVVSKFNLNEKDLIVDIGSNVGILLLGFKNNNCRVLGIEPSKNVADLAEKNGIPTYNSFWGSEIAEKIKKVHGLASVITGTNVFAHVDDLVGFVKAIDILLKDDGVFIFESPNALEMSKTGSFFAIYHEHLTTLSLRPVIWFLNKIGFDVFHVEKQDVHEGSFRVFICRKGKFPVDISVISYLKEEFESKIHELETWKEFAKNAIKYRYEIVELLNNIKKDGKTIALLSMPAKGQTLLGYCNIGAQYIDFATDKSELKIGKFSPGQEIEVFGDEELLKRQPDYAIVLAHNFQEEIMKNNQEYKDRGGRFITLLPRARII